MVTQFFMSVKITFRSKQMPVGTPAWQLAYTEFTQRVLRQRKPRVNV